MSGISLTASMRSNLLSLQNIARQQDIVQNRLATGLKVSSAIDNPSSYYTASSLNNRAADLTALLDAMSQGIQTIKAASETLEAGAELLTQAAAVCTQAAETCAVPAKEWFEKQDNVIAVVTNEEELRAAIASGQTGDIVIYGEIQLSASLKLQDRQNLVGVGYYGNFDNPQHKFSSLSFDFSKRAGSSGIIMSGQHLLSDLTVSLKASRSNRVVECSDNDNIIQNIDIRIDSSLTPSYPDSGYRVFGISSGRFELKGINNICQEGTSQPMASGIDNCRVTLKGQTILNINLTSTVSRGIGSSTINIGGRSTVNIISGDRGTEFSDLLLNDNATLNIQSYDAIVYGNISLNDNAQLNAKVSRKVFVASKDSGSSYHLTVNINSAAVLINAAGANLFNPAYSDLLSLNAVAGSKIHYNGSVYQTTSDISRIINKNENIPDEFKNIGASSLQNLNLDNLKDDMSAAKTENRFSARYSEILRQYDQLIKDGNYKGINLLDGQNLNINFNEDRSSKIEIAGSKISTAELGISGSALDNLSAIEKSIEEIKNATDILRGLASAFGNYYSIVTTRQDFTENLINVLEEGADKLTLADMNQESANMLALQTSQQLAVNSLSLASQAAQAVLKLF